MLQILTSIARVTCLVALATIAVGGQPSGQLAGVVRDTTGSVLPGVTVTVTGPTLIASRSVVTNGQGQYVVDGLPPGRYLVAAVFPGFEAWRHDVEIEAGRTTLDVMLVVSRFDERITLTATKTGAADIQSTPVAITVLTARTLEQMGTRTVEGLAGMVPTVTMSQHTGSAQVTIRGSVSLNRIQAADLDARWHRAALAPRRTRALLHGAQPDVDVRGADERADVC